MFRYLPDAPSSIEQYLVEMVERVGLFTHVDTETPFVPWWMVFCCMVTTFNLHWRLVTRHYWTQLPQRLSRDCRDETVRAGAYNTHLYSKNFRWMPGSLSGEGRTSHHPLCSTQWRLKMWNLLFQNDYTFQHGDSKVLNQETGSCQGHLLLKSPLRKELWLTGNPHIQQWTRPPPLLCLFFSFLLSKHMLGSQRTSSGLQVLALHTTDTTALSPAPLMTPPA